MAFRVGLLGGSEADVAEGLAWLRSHGVEVVVRVPPRETSPGRWMATVTPEAPAVGEGPVER